MILNPFLTSFYLFTTIQYGVTKWQFKLSYKAVILKN